MIVKCDESSYVNWSNSVFFKYCDGYELWWCYWIIGSVDKNYNFYLWEEFVYLDVNI